jgi:glycosyltransferase involved in cell wall biosynthesis
MASPKVTFIVPCYKLAHLLPECVNSILAQTFTDFEILVMDDCSPDHTADVARSFGDPRVKHVRNDPNLGHARNYNKGLSLAAGRYVWLISADDVLRTTTVLERYVDVLDRHPKVGFAFCPGYGLLGNRVTEIVRWATLESPDAILNGRTLLKRLLESNCVLAPSVLARKECYDRLGVYPLDLPYANDWYMWCLFALHHDVAYFAEPMVYYREHEASMTGTLISEDVRLLSRDDLAVRWRMKKHLEDAGEYELALLCKTAIVSDYVQSLGSKRWRTARFRLSLEEFDRSLELHVANARARDDIRHAVFSAVGTELHWDKELETDLRLYRLAIKHGGVNPKLRIKYAILRLGAVGTLTMRTIASLRALSRSPQA